MCVAPIALRLLDVFKIKYNIYLLNFYYTIGRDKIFESILLDISRRSSDETFFLTAL